jgi:hypothetical protein
VSLYLLVCGSRDWKDRGAIADVLAAHVAAEPDVRVVTGGARGADTIAHDYAMSIGLATKVMPADWDRLGKRAGYVRNEAMLDLLVERACDGHAVAVEAFTDGSPGTQHTCAASTRTRSEACSTTGSKSGRLSDRRPRFPPSRLPIGWPNQA